MLAAPSMTAKRGLFVIATLSKIERNIDVAASWSSITISASERP